VLIASPEPPVMQLFESLRPPVTLSDTGTDSWSSMQLTYRGVQADGSAGGDAVAPGDWETARRLPRMPLALVRPQPGRRYIGSAEAGVAGVGQPIAASQLAVRWERDGTALVIWLTGALDRATATVLDRELDARAIGTMHLIVDLTGLESIDSLGLDTLVSVRRRVTARRGRLSFRHGRHVAQRPRGLVCAVQLGSERAPRSARLGDEDSYFALAMACADLDHRPPGDRPRAALNRLPTLAPGASDAPPSSRIARAAPLPSSSTPRSGPIRRDQRSQSI